MELDASITKANLEIPSRMVANGSDLLYRVLSHSVMDGQIQTVLEMKGHVDEKRLAQAVHLSTIAEPILGCRFVADPPYPFWQRRLDLDTIALCSVQETDNKEEALHFWLSSPLDLDLDPLVRVLLLRTPTNDTLCIKIHHACGDGAGSIQYASLLASLYNELSRDPAYQPQPNPISRDQGQMFLELGLTNISLQQATKPHDQGAMSLRPPEPCAPVLPFTLGEPKNRRQVIRRIPQWRDLFHGYRQRGITINDILLAAYWRALYKNADSIVSGPLNIAVTVDLRRYLPTDRVNTICNLSSAVHIHLHNNPDGTLRDSAKEVSLLMKQFKNDRMDLQNSAIFFDLLAHRDFDTFAQQLHARKSQVVSGKSCFLYLANLGEVSKSRMYLGDTEVFEAYIVGQAYYAPNSMLVVSTYQECITLACAFFESNLAVEWVERLLDSMVEDICAYH